METDGRGGRPRREDDLHTTVTITDADRSVDYTLAVACDFLAGTPAHRGWLDGGHPGEAPAVEINAVRCLEVALWCGKYAVSAFPAADTRESLEKKIGQWCLDRYPEEIEQAVLELAAARRDARDEPEEEP
jgi:hypothetical protein